MLPTRLVVDIIEIPDTVSITVARRVAMRWRHHLRCTVPAAVAFGDEHTGWWDVAGSVPPPQDSTAPPRLLHRARVSRADTAQRQGITVRPSTADSPVTGDNRI